MISQRPICVRPEREQPALAETGSLVTAYPELLIIRFGVGESIFNRLRLFGFASYFSLGNDEATNPLRFFLLSGPIPVAFVNICCLHL